VRKNSICNKKYFRKKSELTHKNFADLITETFTVNTTDGIEVELKKPSGKSIRVTFVNRLQWADLVQKFRLSEFDTQIAALKKGFAAVIPLQVLYLFCWYDIESFISGSRSIDLELLKKHTVYRGCLQTDRQVQFLWKVLESFSEEERSLFLRFTWGRSRLPLSQLDFNEEMKVHILEPKVKAENPDDLLPQSHTCFFELELPAYSTYDITREKLLYAITECHAIDTDYD